ncbi:MAG: TrmH family RNA methyltransferase [Actinomycetota bacterium]
MTSGLSARNLRVLEASKLHRAAERRARGMTLLEGPHLVGEALAAGIEPRELFVLDPGAGFDGWVVTEAALQRLSGTKTPQSPVAVIPIPAHAFDPTRSALVAWQIADPGNLGTMIRTAAAFGLDIGVGDGADPWAPKTLRAGAGAHFHTAVVTIRHPRDAGAELVATVLDEGRPPDQLPKGRLAVMIGNEAHGLPADLVAAAGWRVTIPMPGHTESLNAATTAAIVGYEVARRSVGNLHGPS